MRIRVGKKKLLEAGEALKQTLKEIQIRNVQAWMKANINTGRDAIGEISMTKLAEAAVDALLLPHSYLDDETHWIWDVAANVADEFENC